MVVVIIAMAFIGILASVLMYMSLLNYQMKVNNLKAKDNFYSAETVLDEIRTAMGERVSASVGSAYELVLKNYEATSAEEKQNKLRYYFLKDMQDYYAVTGSMNINNYDLTKLFNSLSSEIKRGTVLETLNDSGEVVYRMALDSSGSLKVYVMTTDPVTGNKERVETTDIPTGRFQLYTDGLSFWPESDLYGYRWLCVRDPDRYPGEDAGYGFCTGSDTAFHYGNLHGGAGEYSGTSF